MASKKGAGEPGAAAGSAKKAAPAKGARSAGDVTPPRSTRSTKAAGAAAETGSAAKGAASRSTRAQTSGTTTTRKAGADGSRAASSARGGAARKTGAGADKKAASLKKDLRDFAGARPDGWSHDDWLRFLDDLKDRGHNINDRDEIGSMLERERLALALERIPGVGPQRVRSIADRYGYLWRLRETDADQLAREADVPRPVAEKVLDALRR
jgi:hypothetical protein